MSRQPRLPEALQTIFEEKVVGNTEFLEVFPKINQNYNVTLMAYHLWQENAEKEMKFFGKRRGAASGLIFGCEGKNMYVKDFATDSVLQNHNNLCELFTYKLLETLGFGAQVEAKCVAGQLPFLVSHDLQREGNPLKLGEYASSHLRSLDGEQKQTALTKILAMEILAKILGLGDLAANEGNYGIVCDAEKGEAEAFLVDFNYSTDPKSQLSKRGTNVKLEGMQSNLASQDSARVTSVLALTRTIVGSELNEEFYQGALEQLNNERLEAAIEAAKSYCLEFLPQITDEEVKRRFSANVLDSYIGSVRGNIQKLYLPRELQPELQRRRSSKEMVEGFMESELGSAKGSGSGGYVEFAPGSDPDLQEESETDAVIERQPSATAGQPSAQGQGDAAAAQRNGGCPPCAIL